MAEDITAKIKTLTNLAEISGIPIDGMVLHFDSFSYSASLGRSGHHYNDGILTCAMPIHTEWRNTGTRRVLILYTGSVRNP